MPESESPQAVAPPTTPLDEKREPEDVPIPEVETALKEGKFDMEFPYVPLEAMNAAPYNPRKISTAAIGALASSLDEYGLVQPLIWNKRTGNLVGGHQRYKILQQRGVKEVKTCVVDLELEDEQALNITLNNPEVQGTFDGATLKKLLTSIKSRKTKNQFKRSGLEALENQISLFDDDVKKPELKPAESGGSERDLSYITPDLRLMVVATNSLKADKNNVRTHDDRNRLAVRNSLAQFGQLKPIAVYNGIVIAGNCTWEETKALGREWIAVTDCSHLTIPQAVAFGLVDNKSAQLAVTDGKKLTEVLRELKYVDQGMLAFTGFAEYEVIAAIDGRPTPIAIPSAVPIGTLKPHPQNYRVHPMDQLADLAESIKKNGMYRAVVVANDDTILAGHGIYEAAKLAGMSEIPIVKLDLQPDDPKALAVLAGDNEVGHFSEVDDRQLTGILKAVSDAGALAGTGYDAQRLAALVYTTRPQSEIGTMDEASHWVGMPGFDPVAKPLHITVNFEDEPARDSFFEKLAIEEPKLADSLRPSMWWPPKAFRQDLASLKFDRPQEAPQLPEGVVGNPPALATDPKAGLDQFCDLLAILNVKDDSIKEVKRIAQETISFLKSTKADRAESEEGQKLMTAWYESVTRGRPDWGVYSTDYYLAELWACWIVYSRQYLASILRPSSLPPGGVICSMGSFANIVDLGCGIGMTTGALKQIYPTAAISATNFGSAIQTEFARMLGKNEGFQVHDDISGISLREGRTLVFASEYFEHLIAPIDHLQEVVSALKPDVMLTANSFTARSIGHFDEYQVGSEKLDGAATSRAFNEAARGLGYEQLETRLWNGRPAAWMKKL